MPRDKRGRYTKRRSTRRSSDGRRTRRSSRRMGDPERGLWGAAINVGVGAVAGIATRFISPVLHEWTAPAVYIPVGIVAGNEALETIGGTALGSNIGFILQGGASGSTSTATARY